MGVWDFSVYAAFAGGCGENRALMDLLRRTITDGS